MTECQLFYYKMNELNRFIRKSTSFLCLIILLCFNVFAQDEASSDDISWKKDLQILLGFSGDEVDGIMGLETFNALKRFAYHHDLTDVVMRGQFEDIEYWGFEQYLIKYHKYWIREIKNQRIFNDIHDKEYLQQADETLYTFEIAIQNAKLEVERLAQAQSKALREAKEKQELENWEMEKREAERLTAELNQSILEAEVEADKWAMERLRAQRLASEKEQLDRLNSRKAEANRLSTELGDIISSAKGEIDRLIDENKKMKKLIENSEKTETMAEELLAKLSITQQELDSAKMELKGLSSRNDTLEIKLDDAKLEIEKMIKNAVIITKADSQKQKKWYQNFALNINNNNLISQNNDGKYVVTPTIGIDVLYYLPWKPKVLKKEFDIECFAEYSPSFTYNETSTHFFAAYVRGRTTMKWNIKMITKFGFSNVRDTLPLSKDISSGLNSKYFVFSPGLEYELPLKYKIISTSFFLSPHVSIIMSGGEEDNSQMIYWNTGFRIAIN